MMPERNTKDEKSSNTKWTKIDQNEKKWTKQNNENYQPNTIK